jgi:ferredoxin-NADP reductase
MCSACKYIDLHLPNGATRQYFLTCCDPAPTSYTLGIKRDAAGRGGSRLIFECGNRHGGFFICDPPHHSPLP